MGRIPGDVVLDIPGSMGPTKALPAGIAMTCPDNGSRTSLVFIFSTFSSQLFYQLSTFQYTI